MGSHLVQRSRGLRRQRRSRGGFCQAMDAFGSKRSLPCGCCGPTVRAARARWPGRMAAGFVRVVRPRTAMIETKHLGVLVSIMLLAHLFGSRRCNDLGRTAAAGAALSRPAADGAAAAIDRSIGQPLLIGIRSFQAADSRLAVRTVTVRLRVLSEDCGHNTENRPHRHQSTPM